jgi:hypothetical protein
MLSVPADHAFARLVTQCREDGMSSASIAAVLNQSEWADPYGRHWNYRQVAALCWSTNGRPVVGPHGAESPPVIASPDEDTEAGPDLHCTRADCEFHRLQAILRSVLEWAPFDPEPIRLISISYARGASARTITAQLNRAHLRPPVGHRWSAGLVRALVDLYAFEREEPLDPKVAQPAFATAAA